MYGRVCVVCLCVCVYVKESEIRTRDLLQVCGTECTASLWRLGYESGWQSCSLIGMKGLKYLSLEFDKEDFNQTVGDMIRREENLQPFLY
jgi:hypothetical protein